MNKITRPDAYPLPRKDTLLDGLNGAAIFTSLDLQAGYWQIEMEEEDKPKTAFISHMGLFEFQVMPFGLMSVPATFHRLMSCVLAGLTGCLVYIDFVIIFSNGDPWGHLLDIIRVFERIREGGLKLKGKKCFLAMEKLKFLGIIVSHFGIQPDPEKVRAIREFPSPETRRHVKSFVGATSFYRIARNRYAYIALPLTQLFHKDSDLKWGDTTKIVPGAKGYFN